MWLDAIKTTEYGDKSFTYVTIVDTAHEKHSLNCSTIPSSVEKSLRHLSKFNLFQPVR